MDARTSRYHELYARAQRDPDYRWLVADIAALEDVRTQRSVSLNLKARLEERARLDRERLERENNRRSAKNLPLLKSLEELEKAETPDIVLAQAAEVMADMVSGVRGAPAATPRKQAARR